MLKLEDIVVEHEGNTYSMGVEEEDGKIFTTMPDNLHELESPSDIYRVIEKLRDAFKPPEEAIINNIEYNPNAAKFFKERFQQRQLETMYYLSLGYNDEVIAQNMLIGKTSVMNYITSINYRIIGWPDHLDKRVSIAMNFPKAFPHIFPMRQYDPIELTDRKYEIARMIAEGRTNSSIAEELVISASTVKSHVKNISRKIGDQLPSGYDYHVHIANIFSSGAFYSESNNPTGVR